MIRECVWFLSIICINGFDGLLQPEACFSPQHGHYSNTAAPNLQHTTDTTQTQPHQISNTPQTLLKPSRTKSPTHHGHYSNPAAPNLQHTTDTTQAQQYQISNTPQTLLKTQPHQISNTQRTENKKIDVVIQQHSRKLLTMDILISETF